MIAMLLLLLLLLLLMMKKIRSVTTVRAVPIGALVVDSIPAGHRHRLRNCTTAQTDLRSPLFQEIVVSYEHLGNDGQHGHPIVPSEGITRRDCWKRTIPCLARHPCRWLPSEYANVGTMPSGQNLPGRICPPVHCPRSLFCWLHSCGLELDRWWFPNHPVRH